MTNEHWPGSYGLACGEVVSHLDIADTDAERDFVRDVCGVKDSEYELEFLGNEAYQDQYLQIQGNVYLA